MMKNRVKAALEPSGEAAIRNLLVAPKKWCNMVQELSELCSASGAKEAMQNLTEHLSSLLVPQSGLLKSKESLTETDLKRVIRHVNQQQGKMSQTKFSSLFATLLDAVVVDLQQEGPPELVEAVRSLPLFAKLKKNASKDSVAESADFAGSVLELVQQVCETNHISEYLVLLKLLLGLWVRGAVLDFSSVGTERLLSAGALLKTHSILSTVELRRIATSEELSEHAQTFQCTPRLLLTSGRPAKLTTYEVQGKAVGTVSCIRVTEEQPPQYFEVTLKGREFAGVRVGWALCGAELGDCSSTNCGLGSSDEAWVFEPFNGHFFHHSRSVARSRRGPESVEEGEGEDEGHDEESLFAGLFEDSHSAEGAGDFSGRDARLSGDSGMSFGGSEDAQALMNHLFLGSSAEAGEGGATSTAGTGSGTAQQASAQAFLDLVREEDRGDVSNIRRFLMARGLASQAQRVPGGAPFAGQEGSTATAMAAVGAADRAESRTSFGVLSDIATAAPSEISEHSAPSTFSRDTSSATPATLSRSAKESRSRAAWREGGQALLVLDAGDQQLSAAGTEGSEKQAADVPCYPIAAGTTVGCLLLPATGEVRFFLEGVCVGTAPDRIPAQLLAERGARPVFCCAATAGLEVNIGQAPLRFEAEVAEHLQQGMSAEERATAAPTRAAFTPLSRALNPYLVVAPSLAGGGVGDVPTTGVLIERLQSEGHKAFTLECSFRLAESAVTVDPSASAKEGSQQPSSKAGDLSPSGSGLFAESGPSTPTAVRLRRFCLVCCGPKADSGSEGLSPATEDLGCSMGVDSRGALYFELQGGETVRTMTGLCQPAQWYHIAVTYVYHRSSSKATVTFFVNGVPVTQQDIVSSKRPKVGRILPRTLSIGGTYESKKATSNRSVMSAKDAFTGDLCEVRVWGTARSPERIAATTGRGKVSGVEPDLIALFPMEEGYGSTVHDAAIVRNMVRAADAVVVQGGCVWGNSEGRADTEPSDNHLVIPCLEATTLTTMAQTAVAAVEAAQQVDVTDVEDMTTRPSNITSLVGALVTKLLFSSDIYQLTYASAAAGSPTKKLADQLAALKSVCDGSDATFLLIDNVLRQTVGYLAEASSIGASRASTVSLLAGTAHALLAVLRANLDVVRHELVGDTTGKAWSACGDDVASDAKSKIFNSLLIALLRLVSGLDNEAPWVQGLRSDAVATVVAGLDLFIPSKCNQFFALECLALKASEDQRGLHVSPLFHTALNILLAQSGPVKAGAALTTDPLEALLTMSKQGDDALFAALSGVVSAPSFVAHLIPEQLRPVTASSTDSAAVYTIKSGHSPVTSTAVVPKPGDLVQRAQNWNHENQDGGAGSLGLVVEVGAWAPTDSPYGSKVVVKWRNGAVNSYRYGAGAEPQFDVALLRPSHDQSSTKQPPQQSRVKGTTLFRSTSDDTGEELYPRLELAYTPEEVRVALEDEKGSGAITKRSVLSYIKETAPNEWQEYKRLMKPVNALVGKMSPSDVCQVYAEFYATFSASSAKLSSAGRVLRVEPRCTARVATTAEADLPYRVERLCAQLLQRLSATDRAVGDNGEMQLLASVHCLLLGASGNSDSSGAGVRTPLLSDRVARGTFTTVTGANTWDWRRGSWETKADESSAKQAGAAVSPLQNPGGPSHMMLRDKAARLMGTAGGNVSAKILSDLSIDRNYLGRNMQVKSRLRSVEIVQSGDREWSTCICTTALHPFTGVYKWYVRIKSFSERRGHCLIGVATADFSHDEFLGQHQESWGVSPGLDLFHGGRKRRSEADRKLNIGSTVEVTLDTNKGALTFTELNVDGSPAVIEPVGFDNVRGVVVYPAFSLYSPGDCISIFTNAEDISSLRMRDAAFRTPTKAEPAQSASSKPPSTVMLGAPQPAVVQYALQLVATVNPMLRNCATGEDVLTVVQNPLVSVALPHLLGSLCRWRYAARCKAKELSDALVLLLSRLRQATSLLRGFALEGDGAATPATIDLKKTCDEVLVQLSTSVAAYLGRIATSWIRGTGTQVDNESLSLEEQQAPTTAMLTPVPDGSLSPTAVGGATATPVNWLASALFAQGLRSAPSAEPLLKSAQLGDAAFEEFISWLEVHDRTHKNFRRFGGETLDRPVRLLFAVSLYHSGHLQAASHLKDLYCDYATQFASAPCEQRTEAQQAVKPPLFAVLCWESAMKTRRWAKEVASSGMSYDFAAQRITQRCLFLLGLEPSVSEQPFDRSVTQLAAWATTSTSAVDKQLSSIASQVRRFVTDSCSLPFLRAAAVTCTRSAELRRDGFRVVRAAMGHISPDIGCAAKCALVAELPSALRAVACGTSGASSDSSDKTHGGHYMDGLEALSQSLRMEMQGAFDAYFACLAEELAASSHGEDCAYQLALLDCLGVRLLEQDHTMLSRVNFFFTLQEMLDGTLALQSSPAVTAQPRSEEDREATNPCDTVVKAAMKLFILMALQVATTRDEEVDHTSFPSSYTSMGDLQAPALRKIKSGPATLSNSVFDIVYSQLSEVSKEVLSLAKRLKPEEHFVPTLYISPSAQLITSEAVTLLLCVSRNSVCQKILLKAKWITLLLQMAVLSEAECQQRALLLLSDLLTAMDPQALQLEQFNAADLPSAFAACWAPGVPLAVGLVNALLVLIGQTMLYVGSQALLCTTDADFLREITEVALPVMSEAVALVRQLYLAPTWTATVEQVLIQALQQDLSKEQAHVPLVAALCVLGGQVDAPYRGSPVVFQNTSFGASREPCVGVFNDYGDTPDKAQIACFRSAEAVNAASASALLLQGRVFGGVPVAVASSAVSPSGSEEVQGVVVVPLDKVQAVNRCPIEKLAFTERLVEELLRFFAAVVLPGGLMERAARGAAQAEAKEETVVAESKESGDLLKDPVKEGLEQDSSLVPSVHQLIATVSSRVLSVIAERAATCDVLLSVLTKSTLRSEIVATLLDEAQQPNKSGGLADLPVYEEYLMIALRQRQKLWATKREAVHAAAIVQKRSASQPGVTVPKSPLRQGDGQPSTPFVRREGSPRNSGGPMVGSGVAGGPGSSLSAPPPPPFVEFFSTGIPHGSAEAKTSERSLSPFPPRAPVRPSSASGGRRGGRGRGGLSRSARRWDGNRDSQDEQYDFAEERADETDQFMIDSLAGMGFPPRWCEIALDMTGGDPEEALNYILSNTAQLEEMAATIDAEEEEARNLMAELSGLPRSVNQADATPSVVEVPQQSNASTADGGAEAVSSGSQIPGDANIPQSDVLRSVESTTSDVGTRMAHVDNDHQHLVPFYAEPSFSSERVGCFYPGDSFAVIEVRPDHADPQNSWYKVPYADFEDGNYQPTTSRYGNGPSEEIFVWAPKVMHRQEVIRDGPNENDMESDVLNPRGELLAIDRMYRIIGANGALVREGVEVDSGEVRSLSTGDVVHAYEETYNSEGTLRLHIDRPVHGWISKLFGLVTPVAGPLPTLSVEVGPPGPLAGSNKDTPGSVSAKSTEMEHLDKVEDNMEFYSAGDTFTKDDRFFGSQQGSQYSRHRDREKIAAQALHNRRMRVSGMNSMSGYSQGLMKQSVDAVDAVVHALLRTLQKLYCRRVLLALLLRDCKQVTDADSQSETRGTVLALAATVESMQKFYRFLRMLVFRGYPHSVTSLEHLRFTETVAAAMEPGSVTVEQVFDAVIVQLLAAVPSDAVRFACRAEFIPMLVDSVAKSIRLASATKFSEHVWADSSYEEDLDNDIMEQPNLHYATWITRLLLLQRQDDVSVNLFQCWSVGLRVTSMSMKLVVFSNLADILSAMRDNALKMQSKHSSLVLQACLAMLPIQRLLTMGTKKLWAEMEDAPAFSRFLQAFLHFLSEIDLSKCVIDQEALDVSGEVSPVPTGPAVTPKPTEAPEVLQSATGRRLCFLQDRPVVHLKSQNSFVQLSPQKEIAGPWTVELWLRRDAAPVPPSAAVGGSGMEAAAGEEDEEEDEEPLEDDPFGSGGPGGLRRLSGITEKLHGVLRSELMHSDRAGRDRLGLTGLLSLLLGTTGKSDDPSRRRRSAPRKAQSPPKPDPAGRIDLPGMVLLSSSKGSIKLQAGGKAFRPPPTATTEGAADGAVVVDDPLQVTDPVHEEAYCLSFAPGGGSEKRMDCVIPTGRWLHLAIVCQTAPMNLMTVYIDGEVQDSLSMAMNLPLSVLGSNQPGASFIGDVAEMRVWSQARSRLEIIRDLDRDVSGAKSLVSHLRCNEGRGRLTHDKAGIFNSCKLHNASWATVPAPALRASPMPAFMLGEPEEAEGLFGSDIGSGAQVVEMTGTIKVQSVVGAQGELANDISEVVCLVYRAVNNGSATAARNTPIEGYLNWCERDLRTKIAGTITQSGTVQFSIAGDSVILGAPESLEWLRGLRFEGTLVNGQVKGSFMLSTAVDTLPAVAPGSSRIDQLTLPSEIRHYTSSRAAAKAYLLVKEGSPEGQYIATVEVAPYPRFDPPSAATTTGGTGTASGAPTDITSPAQAASVEVSPRPTSTAGSEVGAAQQVDSDLVAYGLCSHQGGLWVEWQVNANCGNIAFGATTCDGLTHPDASVDANDDTWTYNIAGQASHGANLQLCDTAEEGDIISMQIDTDQGFIRFYKNNEFLIGFDDLNEHPKMNPAYQPPTDNQSSGGSEYSAPGSSMETFQPGIRPFVSLVAVADSVSYMGLKSGNVELLYPADDAQGRCRLASQIVDGCLHGFGLLTTNANSEKWFGNWVRGVENGLHLRVDDNLNPDAAVGARVYEGGRLVREASALAEDLQDQVTALRAAYSEFAAQRTAAADAESAATAAALNTSVSPPPRVGTPVPAPGTTTSVAPHPPTAADLLTNNKITVVLHDTAGENSYFKIMRSVISKKLFAAYAAKRDCPVRTFVFKYNGTVIDGESTIESNGIDNNATIEVTVNSVNALTASPAELEAFLDESAAPYVVQILYESGALVRSGVEIETNALRTLPHGEVIECFKKSQSSEGVGRFRVADGWISEKLRGGNEAPVVRILAERLPRPVRYKVIRDVRIRRGPSLNSEDIGFCPVNTVLTVSDFRYVNESRDESDRTVRVRIDAPVQWRGGWASVKPHILEKLPDSLAQDGTVLTEAEVAVQAEKDRRARVRAQRKVKAEMLKSKEQAAKRRRRIVQTSGTLDVSQETFFLLKRRRSSDGAQVSSDFTTVSCDTSSCGRTMVVGTRGFTRGVHYWEVYVNAASWGSVFIGVAPHESSSWNGYGLLNYRATQAFGSETLYGSYFSVGDKVGVLLDMDHGTISFFKDGEDFNVGRTNVVNMGVAYHNMRRIGNRSSSSSMLYPCFGVKSTGDSLTIRRNHWVSSRGLAPSALLQRILQAKAVIHNWNAAYQPGVALGDDLVHNMFQGYMSWTDRDKIFITSRPGISVQICTSAAAIARAAGPCAQTYALKAGKIVRTAYGEGKILGARHNQLWYSYTTSEQSAWYWRTDELQDLIDAAIIKLDVEEEGAVAAPSAPSPVSLEATPPTLTLEDFRRGLLETTWSLAEDELITRTVNTVANKYDLDPQRIPASVVEAQLVAAGILPGKSSEAIHARYAALCVVNKAAAVALPFEDFNSGDVRLPFVGTSLPHFDITRLSPSSRNCTTTSAISQIKRVIFTQTKMKVWLYAIKESTTPTTAPADEYERPDDLREITINRVAARNAEKMKDSLSFQERLRVSVFGQLMGSMGAWDERALRRAFVHMQDAGQGRAFFVKFSGEGVDDQGGPYRAVFQTAVGEEAANLLDLLVPCPNATMETGENRDRYLINPAVSTTSALATSLVHLGKLVGLACRHNILVALSLPKIIWKPLAGEAVDIDDLQAVDVAEANALKAIAAGEMPQEQMQDLLVQALTSSLSARGLDTTVAPTLARDALAHAPAAVREAVQLVQQLRLTSQTDGLKLMYRGMSAVVPTELLPMFSAEELEAIFCGEAEVDIAVLQKATQYESVSPTDSHIQYFWEAVQALSRDERSQLINFCSGRSRLPAAASDFHMSFKLTAPPPRSEKDPDDYLPIARTCFFSLSLPKYTSAQVCLEKLKYAIKHTELMDADFIDRRATSGWENVR